MTDRELKNRIEAMFNRATNRFTAILPPPRIKRGGQPSMALVNQMMARMKEFHRGYLARFEDAARDPAETADWLMGWDMCDGDLKAELAERKASRASSRLTRDRLTKLFMLPARPEIEAPRV